MAVIDIIKSPVTLAIVVIGLIVFITFMTNRKINEQNHKISSMVGLVSTLAEEVSYIKKMTSAGVPSYNPNNLFPINPTSSGIDINMQSNNNLINVSDDDDESNDNNIDVSVSDINDIDTDDEGDDDDEDDEDDDDDDDDDHDDDEDGDDEDDDDEDDDDENDDDDNIIDTQENNKGFKLEYESIGEDEGFPELKEGTNDAKIIHLDEPIANLEDLDLGNSILDLDNSTIDLKKMSLNKLKEYAVLKGLITTTDKISKKALLKLLDNA